MEGPSFGYTLMVAGRRTGKTSFLRLLLDTSVISPTATREQIASVAKFIQGCGGYTSHIRSTSVNVESALPDRDGSATLLLTLIDTPALNFEDEASSSRIVSQILSHVDARFSESVEDERKASTGDHHVHLCIYFLDPDEIVPPSVSSPVVPLAVPRARTNSLSAADVDSVLLEPPVPTNPAICRPTLPLVDIATIRRLSARVNVLPVVARADTLTNDRLAIIKTVIKHDLAKAGIGFGIFDSSDAQAALEMQIDAASGSPPPLLPFALISPDIYSHSDGVARQSPSRHELMNQYVHSSTVRSPPHPASKLVLRKYIRTYRWGCLDVMDRNHCDFIPLREAIFYHMETLQKYTREYLFARFRAEYVQQHQLPARGQLSDSADGVRLPALHRGSKPILAIDTVSHPPTHLGNNRHVTLAATHSARNGDVAPVSASVPTQAAPDLSPHTAASARPNRQRSKKITVACNFCRSRKLKCDGGRPACGQCGKRGHACDYTVNRKNRANHRRRRTEDASESDAEGDGDSGDPSAPFDPSLSPEVSVSSKTESRRNSNVDLPIADVKLPPLVNSVDRRDDASSLTLPPITSAPRPSSSGSIIAQPLGASTSPTAAASEGRREYMHNELPPIATLAVSEDMPHATFHPLRAPVESQVAGRRRTSSASAKGSSRGSNGYGSKIVACNFCRMRKTKCDGGHPACSSCSKRNQVCSYVNDPTAANPKGRPKTAGSGPSGSPSDSSTPSSSGKPVHNGYLPHENGVSNELKRNIEMDLTLPSTKKMKTMDGSAPAVAVTVTQIQ